MAKLVKFMSFYAWLKQVACFRYNFVLILFHPAATNPKLDGNWKKSANVIHFLSFAGMLPVIFGICSHYLFFFSSPSKMEVTCQNDFHDRS